MFYFSSRPDPFMVQPSVSLAPPLSKLRTKSRLAPKKISHVANNKVS